jgi:hypothetical protein
MLSIADFCEVPVRVMTACTMPAAVLGEAERRAVGSCTYVIYVWVDAMLPKEADEVGCEGLGDEVGGPKHPRQNSRTGSKGLSSIMSTILMGMCRWDGGGRGGHVLGWC